MSGYLAVELLLGVLVLTAMAMVLCRGLRRSVLASVVQALALCAIFVLLAQALEAEGLLARSVTTLVLKAIAAPAVILFAMGKVSASLDSADPVIGAPVFMGLTALEFAASFVIVGFVIPASMQAAVPVAGIALGLFLMGLLAFVAHRDMLRQVMGYLLMETGSHLLLALLAPAMPEVAELCVSAVSFAVVCAMCAFAVYVSRVTLTLDSDLLHELKG